MRMATDVKPRLRGRPDEGARDALIEAATELFIERDYADVSTDEILRRAGVSRGALYHHFPGKLDLFRAVYEATETRAVERIAQAALSADGPFEAMVMASRGYLREAETSVELRRIGIMQSRAVLGWEGWREVASRLGLALAEASLGAAMDAGEIRRRDLTTTAHVVLAALIEGATLVATAGHPGPVRKEVEKVVIDLLEGLRD
jgi:AcrR family transcriptional regulator